MKKAFVLVSLSFVILGLQDVFADGDGIQPPLGRSSLSSVSDAAPDLPLPGPSLSVTTPQSPPAGATPSPSPPPPPLPAICPVTTPAVYCPPTVGILSVALPNCISKIYSYISKHGMLPSGDHEAAELYKSMPVMFFVEGDVVYIRPCASVITIMLRVASMEKTISDRELFETILQETEFVFSGTPVSLPLADVVEYLALLVVIHSGDFAAMLKNYAKSIISLLGQNPLLFDIVGSAGKIREGCLVPAEKGFPFPLHQPVTTSPLVLDFMKEVAAFPGVFPDLKHKIVDESGAHVSVKTLLGATEKTKLMVLNMGALVGVYNTNTKSTCFLFNNFDVSLAFPKMNVIFKNREYLFPSVNPHDVSTTIDYISRAEKGIVTFVASRPDSNYGFFCDVFGKFKDMTYDGTAAAKGGQFEFKEVSDHISPGKFAFTIQVLPPDSSHKGPISHNKVFCLLKHYVSTWSAPGTTDSRGPSAFTCSWSALGTDSVAPAFGVTCNRSAPPAFPEE
jgi:hypothetical protein